MTIALRIAGPKVFNQNTQTIVGTSAARNSAAGHRAQRGGIVTDYDSGVVCVP